jgi:hypothetical protein
VRPAFFCIKIALQQKTLKISNLQRRGGRRGVSYS